MNIIHSKLVKTDRQLELSQWKNYLTSELKTIHDFLVSGKIFQEGFKNIILWQEIPELNLENLQKAENEIIESIKKSKTIHKYGYK